MSVNLDLTNSAVDRVRARLGDVHCPYILEDATIEYYLSKNVNNESRTYRELLTVMLFSLSRLTRERAGDVEVYGSEYFRQYLKTFQHWKMLMRVVLILERFTKNNMNSLLKVLVNDIKKVVGDNI